MVIKIKYLAFIFTFTFVVCTLNAQQGEVNISQDSDIDKLLEFKKDVKTSKVFKIQIYQNVDIDRAQNAKSEFLAAYSEWPVDIHWNTPNYKVWVGNFSTRLEADRALLKIKKKYMNAIIFQPKLDK